MTTDHRQFLSRGGAHLHQSAIRRMGTLAARVPDVITLAAGFPDPATFAWTDLRDIAGDLLAGTDASVLQYGPTRGYGPLVEAVRGVLDSRHIHVAPDEIVVTSGSQQGLDLVARVLLDPGDVVLVEEPTYTGAISVFVNAQADVVGVPQDEEGVDLDALEATTRRLRAEGRRIKCFYVVPNFQNPTGLLISPARRRGLLEWAARHDVLLIEDDPYGVLWFEDSAVEADTRAIRADDGEGRVLYLSTFSKTLAPGLRVGWLVAPPVLAERIDTAKQAIDLSTGVLDQRVVYEALRRGVIERALPRLRQHYRAKRDVMEQCLHESFGDQLRWRSPRGGFFLWATLPPGLSDEGLLEHAVARKVIFVTGRAFFVHEDVHDHIRIGFSTPTPERMREGVRRLADALIAAREPPAAQP